MKEIEPRVGLLAFATDTGLGIQTRSLHKWLEPARTMLLDIGELNHMPVHANWYEYDVRTHGVPSRSDIEDFVSDLDLVIYCETPLNYDLLRYCRDQNVKTVCQPNYELLDYMTPSEQRRPTIPRPDLFIAPSPWHLEDIERIGSTRYLPVPIDLSGLPQRDITRAREFFHVAGRPAFKDRNGTLAFIKAVKSVRPLMPDAVFTLYCQQPNDALRRALDGSGIRLVGHVPRPADIFQTGDVLVLPRRYGGLCLPAQEAIGSGIPVLMTDVSPNNIVLPREWLVPVRPEVTTIRIRGRVDVYTADVPKLARRILDLYRHPDAVRHMHEQAKELAAGMRWEEKLPLYKRALSDLSQHRT
ncbi:MULTISPECIES: glycosyltransferase [unclassified Streptomyces]|uniref:glycosyltransferase n=1 Tax=unclassified Streptomyces TaxID=2593676 RepID=UPI00226E121D|nr:MULTISPECIES: glycosyltransferase [unclassified Streptomyces]MCY0924334.1 glycosyltransferase [Streptomyces sp. H27-G5]MCY0963352.1 glycosyltransferase [Streptomyces sp. H27-H5]